MKKYKVTYLLITGKTKTVIYENTNKLPKEKFIEQLFQWKNSSFVWYSNEDMSKIVNMNYVCFVDVEEIID